MTDSPAPLTLAPAASSKTSGWVLYPLGLGILGFVVAFIVAAIPPAHTTTAAGDIVNFPSMFGQYVIALLIALLSAVLLIIGAVTRVLDARP